MYICIYVMIFIYIYIYIYIYGWIERERSERASTRVVLGDIPKKQGGAVFSWLLSVAVWQSLLLNYVPSLHILASIDSRTAVV